MDPMSAVASIVGVIQLATETQKKLRRFENGFGRLQQLELDRTNTILFQVRDILEQDTFEELSQHIFSVLIQQLHTQLDSLFETWEAFQKTQTSKWKDRLIWNLKGEEIRQISQNREAIARTLKGIELHLQHTLVQAETNLAPVEANVSSALELADDKSLVQEVLDWLGPYDSYTRQSEHLSKQLSGTGSWLLKDNKFREWIEHTGRTIWLCGTGWLQTPEHLQDFIDPNA